MKSNPDKCHFICTTNDTINVIVEKQIIVNSKCEKLLRLKFNYRPIFHAHIYDICKKSGLKLSTLSRIAPYMDSS